MELNLEIHVHTCIYAHSEAVVSFPQNQLKKMAYLGTGKGFSSFLLLHSTFHVPELSKCCHIPPVTEQVADSSKRLWIWVWKLMELLKVILKVLYN